MSAIASIPHARKSVLPLFLVIFGSACFDVLFWQRAPGLNVLIFNLAVAGVLVHRYGWNGLSSPARWTLAGSIFAGCMVVVHDSVIATFASVVSLIIAAAFAHEPRIRSMFYAVMQSAASFIMAPLNAFAGVDRLAPSHGAPRRGVRWIKLGVLPLLLVLLFAQLYRAGNPKFDALTAGFMDGFFDLISDVLADVFTARTLFILFGALVCGALVLRNFPEKVAALEAELGDVLVRTRIKRPSWSVPLAMDPLERERRMGMILLVAVNALLAVVNLIDIGWVWADFEVPRDFSLKQFVHEGTWMLIISILLSMLILMYLFRWNQNFYWRSKALKGLAIAWIVQNFVLGVSVFLRNYHYISFHGLAYKRIGVIVFLSLVMVGLVTLFIKIKRRRSFFYLARVNGWAVFATMLILSAVDWDSTIVRYNLAHWNQGEIDVDNYLGMSDKVLPLLYADLDKVSAQMAQHQKNEVRWVRTLDPTAFKRRLDARRDHFLATYEAAYWQEWNVADRRTAMALAKTADR